MLKLFFKSVKYYWKSRLSNIEGGNDDKETVAFRSFCARSNTKAESELYAEDFDKLS
jgi:hypothetical protein